MTTVKVWLGGEGPSELGKDDRPGAIELLLRRVQAVGWHVAGKTAWKDIRKFRVGAALRDGLSHRDVHNVAGLLLTAYEAGCEVVAFTRDADADPVRERAIHAGIAVAPQALDPVYPLHVIGGVAIPCIEGWIVALCGESGTDAMSRERVKALASRHGLSSVTDWGDVLADGAPPPSGSLRDWLDLAERVLAQVVRGEPPAR